MPGNREISKINAILPGNNFVISVDRKGKWLRDCDLIAFFARERGISPDGSILAFFPDEEDRLWLKGISLIKGESGERRLLLDHMTTGFDTVLCRWGKIPFRKRVISLHLNGSNESIQAKAINESSRLQMIPLLYRGVVHDIKTPLQYLKNNLAYLKEVAETRNNDLDCIDALNQSLAGTEKIDNLIRTLLDFQRDNRGHKERFSLRILIESILILIRSNWKNSVEIKTDFEQTELSFFGDRFLMERALFNLIVNSCQAIEGSGGNDRGLITINAGWNGSEAKLQIIDNGPGIAADTLTRIFDSGYTTKSGGDGLGLPVARHIIENIHKGKIEINSIPGEGTNIIIKLPETEYDNAIPGR
jgi:two-component system, NtrC family, sensor kinase